MRISLLFRKFDRGSKRSYYTDQVDGAREVLQDFNYAFGKNYDVRFVPMPVFKPMGKVVGGVASFTKYEFASTPVKYAFPSNFSWPKGLFFLDRCFVKHHFNLKKRQAVNCH